MRPFHTIGLVIASAIALTATTASAQVVIPSENTLSDEQKDDLQNALNKAVTPIVKKCVGDFPRPQFFTQVMLQYDLRKSGELRGGYLPSIAIDSSLYSKTDEERDKLTADGSYARIVAAGDRDIERCLKMDTRTFDSKTSRVAAKVTIIYDVTWKGNTPTLKVQSYDVQ